MKKKKKITLMIIGILLVALIAVGTSYAYWKLSIRQESTNRYTSASCFNVSINLDDSPITLNNAKPLSNEEGLKLEPFTFSIENTCDSDVRYSIELNVLENSTLDNKYVKYSFTSNRNELLGLQQQVEPKIKNANAYQIKTGTLVKGQKQDLELRMWMDQYTPQAEGTQKSFLSKIVVETQVANQYADASGAEQPNLDNGLIPVVWNGKNWSKADIYSKWYDYNEQWWANAVTVTSATRDEYISADVGTEIYMYDIETMWVWIPRYEYQRSVMETEIETEIPITFVSRETTRSRANNYLIHDAFWWDDNNDGIKDADEQLSGFWVAKFEMSSDISCTATNNNDINKNCDLTSINPRIKPNVASWRGARIGTFWTAVHNNMNGENNIYGIKNSDTHLMKNMEWGAVAYLSQSKYGKYGNTNYTGANKEIYANQSYPVITGNSNGLPGGSKIVTQYSYDIEEKGTGASTTGNIYGIYDMSGGSEEYVMGIIKESSNIEPTVGYSTSYNSGWSGKLNDGTDYDGEYGNLKDIGSKYYDLYNYESNLKLRYHKGDATYETKNWYGDHGIYSSSMFYYPFRTRGGCAEWETRMLGVFFYSAEYGNAHILCSSRPVLVAQPQQ